MTTESLTVRDGIVVSFNYTLRLADGELLDSSEQDGPLQYLHGYNQIIPGLENAMAGMKVGDAKDVVVAPEDAYGERVPNAKQLVPHDAFGDDADLELGMQLQLQDTETGSIFTAFVSEIRPEGVVLDFNHPLAGETLYFHVDIADLREATPEEIAHGHVHGEGHQH
ncbi:MAG: peptidylprolyl isomerase [Caldilineae bacterium]|nr:MAG: peptidylprolyl isomerase [Caldilineae bacterium]